MQGRPICNGTRHFPDENLCAPEATQGQTDERVSFLPRGRGAPLGSRDSPGLERDILARRGAPPRRAGCLCFQFGHTSTVEFVE
jgi:hypothetical protein